MTLKSHLICIFVVIFKRFEKQLESVRLQEFKSSSRPSKRQQSGVVAEAQRVPVGVLRVAVGTWHKLLVTRLRAHPRLATDCHIPCWPLVLYGWSFIIGLRRCFEYRSLDAKPCFCFFRGIRSICQSAATGFSKTKPIGRPYERVAARGARGIGGSFEAEMPRLIIFRKFSEDDVY